MAQKEPPSPHTMPSRGNSLNMIQTPHLPLTPPWTPQLGHGNAMPIIRPAGGGWNRKDFIFFLPLFWCLTCSRCKSHKHRDGKVVCSRAQSQALIEVLCHEVLSPVWAQRWDKCILQIPHTTQGRLDGGSCLLAPDPQTS